MPAESAARANAAAAAKDCSDEPNMMMQATSEDAATNSAMPKSTRATKRRARELRPMEMRESMRLRIRTFAASVEAKHRGLKTRYIAYTVHS